MVKIVVYTVITDNYDEVPLTKPSGNFDFFCYLDANTLSSQKDKIQKSEGITYRLIDADRGSVDLNRYYKMLPHEILKEYEFSIYIDGNIRLKADPQSLCNMLGEDHSIALYDQPDRACAYLELDELVRVGLASGRSASKLKQAFRTLGLPQQNGLYEANVIVRKHNCPECIRFMEMWWKFWQSPVVKRDQPLLAFCNYLLGNDEILSIGKSKIRTGENQFYVYGGRIWKKKRLPRFLRRCMSEMTLYRRG